MPTLFVLTCKPRGSVIVSLRGYFAFCDLEGECWRNCYRPSGQAAAHETATSIQRILCSCSSVILKNVLGEDSRYQSVIFELRKLPSLGIASVVSLVVIGEAERQQAKSSPLAAGETRTGIFEVGFKKHILRKYIGWTGNNLDLL